MILLVPIVMLQKLAISASFWILAITVSELLLNPIVYYYLEPPKLHVIHSREQGIFKRSIDWFVDRLLSRAGRIATFAVSVAALIVSAYFWQSLVIGDPTSASPLLRRRRSVQRLAPAHPGEVRRRRAAHHRRRGLRPRRDEGAGDAAQAWSDSSARSSAIPASGYSFSLADIIRAVNMVFHELEPKWGVIPDSWVDVGGLFFIYFSGSPPTETAKYVDPSYTSAHVTFFCKDHKGENIRRIIHRCKDFIFGSQLKDLGITIEEQGEKGVKITQVSDVPNWEKAGPSWVESDQETTGGPFQPGDVLTKLGKVDITDSASLQSAIYNETANKTLVDVQLQRGGTMVEETVSVPWKAAFKLAGGLIGVLAAANEVLFRNDLLMNLLGFGTIYFILLFTYRSFAAGIYMLIPLLLANGMVNAYMGARNIGININTLPIVTVGVGFGIDYALYIVSRTIEEFKVHKDWEIAVHRALTTAGKAVTFTAASMIAGTLFWAFSRIRFDSEMGLLLALWMAISFVGAMTLLPVSLLTFKPKFIELEARRIANAEAARERQRLRLQARRA